ncbi:MAG: hypothetical protein ACOY3P_22235 [Planctomycetota bacterium]
MNIERILNALNEHEVAYMLIGGVNFLLRHQGPMTYDVDIWIDDSDENRARCEAALRALDAEWGSRDEDWGPVEERPSGWLDGQSVFCLLTPHGALDVFRQMRGLPDWATCRNRAVHVTISGTIECFAVNDQDMLDSQLALPPGLQRTERLRVLRAAIERDGPEGAP